MGLGVQSWGQEFVSRASKLAIRVSESAIGNWGLKLGLGICGRSIRVGRPSISVSSRDSGSEVEGLEFVFRASELAVGVSKSAVRASDLAARILRPQLGVGNLWSEFWSWLLEHCSWQ